MTLTITFGDDDLDSGCIMAILQEARQHGEIVGATLVFADETIDKMDAVEILDPPTAGRC